MGARMSVADILVFVVLCVALMIYSVCNQIKKRGVDHV